MPFLIIGLAAACGPITAEQNDTPDGGTEMDAPPDTGALVLSDLALTVLEGGDSRFTIAMSEQPTSEVTIAISSSNIVKASVSPATVTLDATNWSTPQEVIVSAAQDSDAIDEHATVSLSSKVGAAEIAVTVLDDDTTPAQIEFETSTPTVGVVEGMQAVFQVRLTAQPPAAVTVNVASSNTASVGVSPATLTFTAANWNTYQNVVVSGVEDNNLASDAATATVSSSGLASKAVMVTTTDNDSQSLVVSQSGTLTVYEAATATFTVRLAFQPSATTTVSVAPGSTSIATASPSSLTFTTANWNTTQTVTVTGAQDTDYTHDQTTITISSAGAPSKSFTTIVPDNDLINAPSSTTACKGVARAIAVKLNGAPYGGSLTVNASATGGGVSPSSLTFTSSNYSTTKNFSFTPGPVNTSGRVTLTAMGQASRIVDIDIISCL